MLAILHVRGTARVGGWRAKAVRRARVFMVMRVAMLEEVCAWMCDRTDLGSRIGLERGLES